jgi:hypothetical protein
MVIVSSSSFDQLRHHNLLHHPHLLNATDVAATVIIVAMVATIKNLMGEANRLEMMMSLQLHLWLHSCW